MVSRNESEYKTQLRESLSLRGLRSNYEGNIRDNVNYRRFLVPPSRSVYGWPTPSMMIDHNGSENAASLCRKFAVPVKSEGVATWVEAQSEYLYGLANRDSEILASYTKVGDVLINNFLRGTLGDLMSMLTMNLDNIYVIGYFLHDLYDEYAAKIPLPPKERLLAPSGSVNVFTFGEVIERNLRFFRNPSNIASILTRYKDELVRIIHGAPRLPNPLIVYRGFQSERHLRGLTFENPDFISTSVSLRAALAFSKLQYSMYPKRHEGPRYLGGVYEITLDNSIPCIYMESITQCEDEFEVLLPPGLHFSTDSKIHYKIMPLPKTPSVDNRS